MAEKVERGIALMALSGREIASRYLRSCAVPQEVIERVLSGATMRREHGRHLSVYGQS